MLIAKYVENIFLNFNFFWNDAENNTNISRIYIFLPFVFWEYLDKKIRVKNWIITTGSMSWHFIGAS